MALQARYAIPSQRRHWRVTVPILITIGGKDYQTVNWSVSGLRVGGITKTVLPGDTLDVYLKIPFHGFDVGFPATVRICRYDGHERELAAEFAYLDERERETLSTFIQGITTGEMAPIDGVIKRLDLPVTPVTLNPAPSLPAEEMQQRRRVGMRIYKYVGLALAVMLLAVVYANVFQIRVDTAMVTGNNRVITAPAAGDITYLADAGKPIAAGQPLLMMNDPRLNADMQEAELRLQTARIEANRLNAVLELEKKRIGAAKGIVSKQWEASSDSVGALKRNLEVKADAIRRLEALQKQGFVSALYLDRVRGEYFDVERQLHAARQEEARRQQELSAVQAGFQVHDESVQGGIEDSEAMRQAAIERVEMTGKEIDFMKAQKARLVIKAPADGQLVRVFTGAGAAKYGDPVAVFEQGDKRVVQAFLTQDEALHVIPGKTANVYFAGYWWSVKMKVVDVDHYSLTLGQNRGIYQWQNLQNDQFKTVMVTLEPEDEHAAKALRKIGPGTPSTVVFNRFF